MSFEPRHPPESDQDHPLPEDAETTSLEATPPEVTSSETTGGMGIAMMVVAWVLLIGMMVAVFSGVEEQRYNPNQQVEGGLNSQGQEEVILARNAYGHYVATGTINGESVPFMVDTGATTVAMPLAVAERLGLTLGNASRSITAGGVVNSFPVVVDQVSLGGITKRQVRATVIPDMPGEEVLLGMSFLRDLEIIQRNQQMTLRQ